MRVIFFFSVNHLMIDGFDALVALSRLWFELPFEAVTFRRTLTWILQSHVAELLYNIFCNSNYVTNPRAATLCFQMLGDGQKFSSEVIYKYFKGLYGTLLDEWKQVHNIKQNLQRQYLTYLCWQSRSTKLTNSIFSPFSENKCHLKTALFSKHR